MTHPLPSRMTRFYALRLLPAPASSSSSSPHLALGEHATGSLPAPVNAVTVGADRTHSPGPLLRRCHKRERQPLWSPPFRLPCEPTPSPSRPPLSLLFQTLLCARACGHVHSTRAAGTGVPLAATLPHVHFLDDSTGTTPPCATVPQHCSPCRSTTLQRQRKSSEEEEHSNKRVYASTNAHRECSPRLTVTSNRSDSNHYAGHPPQHEQPCRHRSLFLCAPPTVRQLRDAPRTRRRLRVPPSSQNIPIYLRIRRILVDVRLVDHECPACARCEKAAHRAWPHVVPARVPKCRRPPSSRRLRKTPQLSTRPHSCRRRRTATLRPRLIQSW